MLFFPWVSPQLVDKWVLSALGGATAKGGRSDRLGDLGINPVLDLVLDPDHLVGSDLDLPWEGPGSDLAIDAGAGQGGHFLDLWKA